jgi:hypothetical protein
VDKVGRELAILLTLFVFVLERLVKRQMLLYLEEVGDWIKFPDTIHEGFSHLPEVLSK